MASTSKILTDPSTPAGDSTIDGSFSVNFDDDGNITTIVEHVGDSKTVLEPQSQKFKDLQGSNTVMNARNIAKYGPNIESYESLVEEPGNTVPSQTQAQLEENFTALKKKFDNEEKIAAENAAAEQSIATSPTFAEYGYGESRRQGRSSQLLAYPVDIDTDQDHMKITRYEYFRPPANDQRREMFARKTSGPGGADLLQYSKLDGSIILPMPKVVDGNAAEWGDSKVNVIGLAAGELAAGLGLGELGSKRFSNFNI